jgi:3-oxoacyl-[acyl-carrier protein] reductase
MGVGLTRGTRVTVEHSARARGDLLRGRTAIVTGSSSGIGLAIAESFIAHGASVLINGVDPTKVEATASALGAGALSCCADLVQPDQPEAVVRAAVEAFGRLDIVVNNAGYCWDAPLEEMSDQQIHAMLNVHVVAPMRVLRAAAPYLCRDATSGQPPAKVVNISSVSGTMGTAGQANYAAAKAALLGLTKALAKEWGARGVNVNAIAPGFIETRLTAPIADGETIEREGHEIKLGIPEEHRRKAWDLVPMGRPGTAAEVAGAALFLSSALADYVHGQTLSVTGGLAMGMSE